VSEVLVFGSVAGATVAWAVDATARQTAAVTGVATGAGIYVNYAFLAIWLADVLWCWAAPAAYATRSPVVSVSLRVFFLFMFLNGAVIFADGLMRVLGAVAVATAGAAWIRGARV
jgi:hypothetical protein